MTTVAWALVGLGIILAAVGAVPILAWEARSNAQALSDALANHHLASWAWPTVIAGAVTSAVGGLLAAVAARSEPKR